MSQSDNFTVKELATLLRGWLVDTVQQELAKGQAGAGQGEPLGTMLQRRPDDATRQVRARRFREALAGLESTLVGQREIEFRPVLDHVLHNIGASLQGLDLLVPEAGLIDGPELDYRRLATFPALVAPRRYIALPRLTATLRRLPLGELWPLNATIYLTEYREWQPRWFRGPSHDDERFGLFAWSDLYSRDAYFLPMNRVPGSHPIGANELVVLGQRTSLLGRLFDATPRREEHIVRLNARTFTTLLRALLLDYEHLHTIRQREVADQDQLGAMLWDFLATDETDPSSER